MNNKILLIITIIFISYILLFNNQGEKAIAQMAPANLPPMKINVINVEKQNVVVYEELPGRTVAFKVAEIRPQVTGIITNRLFAEGSYVNEGDQLYQIDPALYQAELNSKLADLKKAQANMKSIELKNYRFKELIKIDAVSQQDYDDLQASLSQAEAEIAIAEAEVERAQINLDYTKVYAPISGRIGRSSVTKGALVTANQSQSLAIITLLAPMYVDMSKSTMELMEIRNKLNSNSEIPVEIFLGEGISSLYKEQGTLQFHEVNVDQTTGTVQLRALFPNPDDTLLPGLFVRARLKIEYKDSILIPQKVTQVNYDGSLTAWVVASDASVQPVTIKVKKAKDNNWLVTEGLKEGDQVVAEGFMKLSPGMTIEPILNIQSQPVENKDSGKE